MNKTEIRKEYKKIRDELLDTSIRSNIICKKVMLLDEFKSSDVIALYKSFGSEVDTTSLIFNSIFLGKTVVLPRIENNEMSFYQYYLNERLEKNKYGIYEPTSNKRVTDIDLVIVPGLCFDKEGNRVGYGGGYYDKYLQDKNMYTVGICFKEQIVDRIDSKENDVKVKKLVFN